MNTEAMTMIIHAVVALAIIAAATVLLCLGHIDGTTAMALYTAALAAVGAGTSTALALKVPAKSQVAPPQG